MSWQTNRTYVGHGDDEDDAQTVLEEQQSTGRRGFPMGRKLSTISLRASLPKSWNKVSLLDSTLL